MKPLLFLAIALGVSVIGSLLVVLRHRKPASPYGEVDDFASRMQALAPRGDDPVVAAEPSGDDDRHPTDEWNR